MDCSGAGLDRRTVLLFVLFGCDLFCPMYRLCVNVYCHRVTTQLQLINISHIISNHIIYYIIYHVMSCHIIYIYIYIYIYHIYHVT
jgi:hypothetical protein